MIKTIFFDVGGTLLDAPNLFEKLVQVFENSDKSKDIEKLITGIFFEMYSGASKQMIPFIKVEEIIKRTLLRVSKVLDCDDKSPLAKDLYWDNYVNNAKLYEDTVEVLDELRNDKVKMIIASDADAPLLYEQFRIYNLSKYFEGYCISSEVEAYKPSVTFVQALMRFMPEEPSKALIIGDSKVDILTGKKLGIHTGLKGCAIFNGISIANRVQAGTR